MKKGSFIHYADKGVVHVVVLYVYGQGVCGVVIHVCMHPIQFLL